MKLSFDLRSLDSAPAEQKALIIGAMVEALVRANEAHLIMTREVPALYLAGVSYDPWFEWLDIPALLLARKGDCKSLVAWRIAELRQQGIDARVHAIVTTLGDQDSFHVQLKYGTVTEDPSTQLGMRTP